MVNCNAHPTVIAFEKRADVPVSSLTSSRWTDNSMINSNQEHHARQH
jgi:hypothetical protein